MGERSIFTYFGENVSNHCGYCKVKADDKFTHGMWAHRMTVDDYQALIDRGWRRSGEYCYKPTNDRTCCPQYTIRCNVGGVRLSGSQKRVLRRMRRFLASGDKPRNAERLVAAASHRDANPQAPQTPPSLQQPNKTEKTAENADKTQVQSQSSSESRGASSETHSQSQAQPQSKAGKRKSDVERPVLKRKERRRARKLAALAAKGLPPTELKFRRKEPKTKGLEERLLQPKGALHKLELHLVRSSPAGPELALKTEHGLYESYQIRIHGDPPSKPSLSQFRRFLLDSPLTMRLLRSEAEVVGQEWPVYVEYQGKIHGDSADECDRGQFRDFLVKSPLVAKGGAGKHPGFGSFHQQYWLDGKLIAVGVLDLLPHCVSSVYLFYDPAYAFLNLGTYSALQEMALTRELMSYDPKVRFYYMGFYIHSCPKMRYKGKFGSSELLCPEVYTWHPIADCTPKLDTVKYARFEPDPTKRDEGKGSAEEVLILYDRQAMDYAYARLAKVPLEESEVEEYANLVGKDVASRALLHIR